MSESGDLSGYEPVHTVGSCEYVGYCIPIGTIESTCSSVTSHH